MHFIKLLPDIFVIAIFIVWGLLSVLSQGSSKLKAKLKQKDALNILPNYKFFCPNPIKQDYYLYYRERATEVLWGEWKKIPIGEKLPFICMLWNPYKRDRKALYKIVKDLKRNAAKNRNWTNAGIQRYLSGFVACHSNSSCYEVKITSSQKWSEASVEKEIFSFAHEHKLSKA